MLVGVRHGADELVPVEGRVVNRYDIEELRRIGEWLNAALPIDEDSDGDRVLAAADELEGLLEADT